METIELKIKNVRALRACYSILKNSKKFGAVYAKNGDLYATDRFCMLVVRNAVEDVDEILEIIMDELPKVKSESVSASREVSSDALDFESMITLITSFDDDKLEDLGNTAHNPLLYAGVLKELNLHWISLQKNNRGTIFVDCANKDVDLYVQAFNK